MKSKNQNFHEYLNLNRNYSNQEVSVDAMSVKPVTEETLNQESKICYKRRREELNRRVKSIIEQKKQTT